MLFLLVLYNIIRYNYYFVLASFISLSADVSGVKYQQVLYRTIVMGYCPQDNHESYGDKLLVCMGRGWSMHVERILCSL